jgi:hypothetical protein
MKHYLVKPSRKGNAVDGVISVCCKCMGVGVRVNGWNDLGQDSGSWYCKDCVAFCRGCCRWEVKGDCCEECVECRVAMRG